jgi:hypothetical protein
MHRSVQYFTFTYRISDPTSLVPLLLLLPSVKHRARAIYVFIGFSSEGAKAKEQASMSRETDERDPI